LRSERERGKLKNTGKRDVYVNLKLHHFIN